MDLNDKVRVESLLLADSAEVVNNKLYVLGGGWEWYVRNGPEPVKLAIAVSFQVPWNATNQKHKFEIQVLNDDTQQVAFVFGGEFEIGRPPGLPAGSDQRAQFAGSGQADLPPAAYVIRCLVDGELRTDRPLSFRVAAGPQYGASGTPPAS